MVQWVSTSKDLGLTSQNSQNAGCSSVRVYNASTPWDKEGWEQKLLDQQRLAR